MNCKILPYKRKDILSVQELEQKVGWGIQTFHIPDTWKYSQGEGITVAVADSGCDLNHFDLVDNLLPGKNFINPEELPFDRVGHGTHISGIISAINNNLGIVGVAPKTKIIPIKVIDDDGNGDMEVVTAGIYYAIERKANFILMSMGCPYPIPELQKAIQDAADAGIICFVSAGNMGKSEHLLYPSNYKETISIGSIDKNLHRADFSNTGANLDFLAPGVDILSTVPDNWYALMSGTSMSAPFVCGLACLLKAYGKDKLETADDYRNVLKKYTTNIVSDSYAGDKFYQGYGIITPEKLFNL